MRQNRGQYMPWTILIRDVVLMAATLVLWSIANGWQVSHPSPVRNAAAVAAGVLFSLLWGYLLHEWGHLAGVWSARGRVQPSLSATALKLFTFLPEQNSQAQFVSLTVGGLTAVWLLAAGLLLFLPSGTPAGTAAIWVAVGGATFTTAVEGPVAWRAVRRAAGHSVKCDRRRP